MKRIFFFLIILLLILITIGNRRNVEVSERAMVHAVGIDKTDKGYTVTLQIFHPDGAGLDTQLDTSKPNVFVISNSAATIEKAMELCESQLGKYLFIGHNQIIVLGSDVILKDPEELFGYFLESKENYIGVKVVMSKGKAEQLLNVQLSDSAVASENFSDIIKMYNDNGMTVRSDMLHLISSLKENNSAVLPLADLREASDGKNKSTSKNQKSSDNSESQESKDNTQVVSVNGAVLIYDGKKIGVINNEDASGFNWLTNNDTHTVVNIKKSSASHPVTISSKSTHTKLEKENNKLVYKANIEVYVLQNSSLDRVFEKGEIENLIENEVKDRCENFIENTVKKHDIDVIGIIKLLKFSYPQIYLENKKNIFSIIRNMDYEVKVNCTIK